MSRPRRKLRAVRADDAERLQDVRKALAAQSAKELACRDIAHQWEPTFVRRAGNGYQRTLRCIRCGTQRVEEYDSLGRLVGRSYEYKPSYHIPGCKRSDLTVVRVESLKRMIK